MLREEAIAILIREIDEDIFVKTEYREQLHEALNMGIKALEQEPCEDAISRQAVLNKFKEVCFSRGWAQFRIDFGSCGQRDFLINYIEQLPSVTPHYTDAEIQKMQELEQAEIEKAYELGKTEQQKMGHWIDNHNNTISCDRCHTWFNKDDRYGYMHYCPYCNAKMESEDKE